jgi:hypothetical protein
VKTIIAGSRSIDNYRLLEWAAQRAPWDITEVVSGGARGVDRMGERLAREYDLPVKRFIPDWNGKHGKRAGIERNKDMAHYAEAALLLWDGESRGTHHMREYAMRIGLTVWAIDLRDERNFQVTARNFVAGFSTIDGEVYLTAPILRKWLMGKYVQDALDICQARGWSIHDYAAD